jgi:hypothetical protein
MKKGSFILYDADLDGLDYISDVQAGKLFKAIKNYRIKGEKSFISRNSAVNILYSQIIGHISFNEEKYKILCEKRTEAINKRWCNDKKKNSNEYKSIQKNSYEYLNDNDNENDNVTDNVNVNVNDNETVTDACGAKTENKRKNYNSKKPPLLLQDDPSYDIEAFKRKSLELFRNTANLSNQ